MTSTPSLVARADEQVPEPGELVRVRGQQWVVASRRTSRLPQDELASKVPPGRTMVTLTSVSDDDLGDELTVVWEIEPGREVLPATRLPEVTGTGWDDPEVLGAFLDAVRWGTVASADDQTLQAPFRAGITVEDYQLEPVAKALAMPRVALLLADDVGLGKTIEAGLVIQEMLLRNRARRIVVICPAPLTGKWAEEMQTKFGLDFKVLDAEALKELRRSHGLQANPFSVYPRTIVSLQWLRTPRVQRLLDEVLDGRGDGGPSFFDILLVDEAHHCAPPAPGSGKHYALDSKQTQAVRRLGEHAQHRMFLSATPHNGYSASWQALLEMLDPLRFARGVEPDPEVLQQVLVRRLKETITNEAGIPVFPGREARAVEVVYTDQERAGHALLAQYTQARHQVNSRAGVSAGALVTLLLKKRLFSSPAAFAKTLAVHRSATPAGGQPGGDEPEWLTEARAWDDEPSEEAAGDDTRMLLDRVAGVLGKPGAHAQELLDELTDWAERHAEPADSKAEALIGELQGVLAADERVVVFTEYRDTQLWLHGLLSARGMGGERLGSLYGGMDVARREHLKEAFQADPSRDPLRILLATDTASEGIDLQRHCWRVIHYDIPFNPNRLEQRIGRVDRYGQTRRADVVHFVGAGWQQAAAGSYDDDLEFLSRVAHKVATERQDLGSVNPVLAAAVEARMLGRPVLVDPLQVTPNVSTSMLRAERDLRGQAQRLREQVARSVARLHVSAPHVRRVVDTALALARQLPLVDAPASGEIEPPELRSGWERTLEGLADPLSGQLRPLTFDAAVARGRDDVVLAHLGHPLVAHSTRLLRSAIWGTRADLHRVAAMRFTAPEGLVLRGPLVTVFARLVVVGSDGGRLHEEVVVAAREVTDTGRGRRIDLEQRAYADLHDSIDAALTPGATRPASQEVKQHVARVWPELAPRLVEDVQARASRQREQLTSALGRRLAGDLHRTEAVFDQLRATLTSALAGPGDVQLILDDLDGVERQQFDRDRRAWQSRLEGLDADRERELSRLRVRFDGVRELVFPFAVAVCVANR